MVTYNIEESKLVTVKVHNKKIKFTVPLNLVLTDDYIKEKLLNIKKTKAEEWLKAKGFIEETRGWSLYSDEKITLSFPECLYDNEGLLVKLHRIEGCKIVKFGSFTKIIKRLIFSKTGKKTRKESGKLKKLNNLPDYIDSWMIVTDDILTDFESRFYREACHDGSMLQESPYSIDDHFLFYIIKHDFDNICKYDASRFNLELFKNFNTDVYNILIGSKTINKFNL